MATKRSPGPSTSPTCPKHPKMARSLSPREISSPEPSAVVKALVTSLSPVKPKENMFYGELSDGETVVPLVGV